MVEDLVDIIKDKESKLLESKLSVEILESNNQLAGELRKEIDKNRKIIYDQEVRISKQTEKINENSGIYKEIKKYKENINENEEKIKEQQDKIYEQEKKIWDNIKKLDIQVEKIDDFSKRLAMDSKN